MGIGFGQVRATISRAREAFLRGEFELTLELCGALQPRDEAEEIEIDLLRARALIPLGRSERALDIVRRLRLAPHARDLDLTARMLEGAALVKLSQLDHGIAILSDAYRASARAHPTVRAELAVNLGIAYYRKREYEKADRQLRTVPHEADIVHARALVFQGWVAWDRGEFASAADLFDAALQRIESCRNYDRFVEAAALYGLAFLCAELPRLDWWPRVRERADRFDWTANGVLVPRFWLAIAASYVNEMLGQLDEAREWVVRAESAASSPAFTVISWVRFGSLFGRRGESNAHAYFLRKAYLRYDELRESSLLGEDTLLPLTLAEEIAQGTHPNDAAPLVTYYVQAVAPRTGGTSEEAMLEAAREMTEGLLSDRTGSRAEAERHYAAALHGYAGLGFNRRAAFAAYRLAILTGDERHRAFAVAVLQGAADRYWLKQRLADFGVDDIRLSDRQAEVLRLLAEGKSNKEIAAVRGGSWYTARNIVRELLELFRVHSRSELVRVAVARGIAAREPSD
jgi:DNA-binding CsgD family transcriptional regulator